MKICPYPFSRFEARSDAFVPCCEGWLTEDYRAQTRKEPFQQEQWQSKIAKLFRKKMALGDFEYCRRDVCKKELIDIEKIDHFTSPDCVLDRTAIERIRAGDVDSIEPTSISLLADNRCNLRCPSCRKDRVTHLSQEGQAELMYTMLLLRKHSRTLRTIKLSGNGEVFFSSTLCDFLKTINKDAFPALERVICLTNGLLINEELYQQLLPGISFVREITVSIDAGTPEVYARVRGGNWQLLLRNLKFLSELRQSSKLDRLNLAFVVRKENYRTIPEFVKIASDINADEVFLTALQDWPSMPIDFKSEAVHLSSHPENGAFTEIASSLKEVTTPTVHLHF